MTENEKDYFEERAAIRQYDGKMSREEAERLAKQDLEKKRARGRV